MHELRDDETVKMPVNDWCKKAERDLIKTTFTGAKKKLHKWHLINYGCGTRAGPHHCFAATARRTVCHVRIHRGRPMRALGVRHPPAGETASTRVGGGVAGGLDVSGTDNK